MIDCILVHVGLRRRQLALMQGDTLVELRSDRPDGATRAGDIHVVQVSGKAPELDGVFVRMAGGVDGAISGRHGGRKLNDGQLLIAQVDRAAEAGKGPRLTTRLRLPGACVVLRPFDPAPAVPLRLRDGAERDALLARAQALSEAGDGGILLRSKAARTDEAALAAEAAALRRQWTQIVQASAEIGGPALLWRDDAIAAALRDHAGPALARVVVDDAATATALRAQCAVLAPIAAVDLTVLPPGTQAFDDDGLQAQIAAALAPRLALPGGAWLDLQPTAALTAVDVNAGSAAAAGGRGEPLWLEINLAAAAALGRQLRLRDIGGTVVVDFIRMAVPGHGKQVLAALRRACADDPADVRIAGFSEFGLVELTRRRRGSGLAALSVPCAACAGSGRQRPLGELADDLVDEILRQAAHGQGRPLMAAAAPALLDELGGPALAGLLQQRYGCRVELRAEPARAPAEFEVWTP